MKARTPGRCPLCNRWYTRHELIAKTETQRWAHAACVLKARGIELPGDWLPIP
jgi:hypothetical protein